VKFGKLQKAVHRLAKDFFATQSLWSAAIYRSFTSAIGHDAAVVSALILSPETSSADTNDRSKAAINRSTPKTRCVRKAK